MKIGESNYEQGNKAMASVLLLYYHITSGGGFTGDETVFLDSDTFDGYSYLDTVVSDGYEVDIDQKLIREGAVIYLLCDLNDMVSEYKDDFLRQKTTIKIIDAYQEGKLSAIPETYQLFNLFKATEKEFDFKSYIETMHIIVNKYVVGAFNELASCVKP